MSLQRIPFPGAHELDAATRAQLAKRPPASLYRMVAHAPALLEPFMSQVIANFSQLSIASPVREAVILRVAAHRRSAYEIHHHRRMAKDAGLDGTTIAALLGQVPPPELPAELRMPMVLADALLNNQTIDDKTVRQIVAASGARGYVELAMLVGFYEMVATFLLATGIEPEADGMLDGTRPPP